MKQQIKETPIRIVKKVKKHHGGHHGGAWKVAYADFVTAMMALFIVLWIVGQSKQVKEYIANYFKDPGAFFENTKGGGAFEKQEIELGERISDEMLKRQEKAMQDVAKKILDDVSRIPNLKDLSKQIKIEFTKEGMRIELVESSQAFFFDVGTANLKPEAVDILKAIAENLGNIKNHVVIEGHTDARPYSNTAGYTNFELSADRANSARRILMTNGLHNKQLDEIRGYADTRLRNTADPFDLTNRRISILVKYDGQQ
ncbi:MAG: OmpA family protein [Bacteroidetes bacterium]|nr:OmpA family protein [Bacteroidota bacterium]